MFIVKPQAENFENGERAPANFKFDNSFARELEGCYVPWDAEKVSEPRLLLFNCELAAELGLDAAALETPLGAEIFAGNRIPNGAKPLAQAYAGHQFGNFSPRLGDGRAVLLGEIVDTRGKRHDIQLKGSGRTPFSRTSVYLTPRSLAASRSVLKHQLSASASSSFR